MPDIEAEWLEPIWVLRMLFSVQYPEYAAHDNEITASGFAKRTPSARSITPRTRWTNCSNGPCARGISD
jgi:hypothetical protein